MRPWTLAEVATLTAGGDSFARCLANFLDGFYGSPTAKALVEAPQLLAPESGEPGEPGRVRDAYLVATAEELARAYQFSPPAWIASDQRALHSPWFASPLAALRAVLILESPAAFRSRHLFISENALSRAWAKYPRPSAPLRLRSLRQTMDVIPIGEALPCWVSELNSWPCGSLPPGHSDWSRDPRRGRPKLREYFHAAFSLPAERESSNPFRNS